MNDHMRACEDYLKARTGNYRWRRIRYRAVIDKMLDAGLSDDDIVLDIGCGWTEFDYTLRTEESWRGRYWGIDGQFDGTNLNLWTPPRTVEFIAAIEILEHLRVPQDSMQRYMNTATKLVVATTPNPETTDVLGMDPTHVSPIWPKEFEALDWNVEARSFYGQKDDSLLAWWIP